jgi:hypothetical protein
MESRQRLLSRALARSSSFNLSPRGSTTLWIVTHVDLHRTAKVQAFLEHLKARREARIAGRSVTR